MKRNHITALALCLLACISCSHAPVASVPKNAEMILSPGDSSVGSYVSSWEGFRTSSYWINAPEGLIFIDTQFLLSAAAEMIDWAEKVTGKKALLAIILHPNPDKFNGTAIFQKRGIRVITSQQVLNRIPEVHQLRMGWFYERFKPDYPVDPAKPESFGEKTTTWKAAGTEIKLHVLGAGCSEAHVAVEYNQHLFVGDLVTQGFHSWLELGQLNEWLERIEELKNLEPKFVHTGRGGSGDAELLDREAEYLSTVIDVVRSVKRKFKKLSATAREEITSELVAKYPSYDYPLFMEKGIPIIWSRTHDK